MPAVHGIAAPQGSSKNIGPKILGAAQCFVSFCIFYVTFDLCNEKKIGFRSLCANVLFLQM